SRRRHTRSKRDWSSDVCSSDLNIYEMLYPGGTLILSTPFGEGRGKPCKNPFHVHQLTEEEFQELFVNYASVSYYYQENALIIPAESAKGKSFPLGIVVCRK